MPVLLVCLSVCPHQCCWLSQYGHSLSQSVAFDSLLAFILVMLIVVICTCLSLARARTDSVSDQSLEWIQSLDRVNHGPEWTVQADCVIISYSVTQHQQTSAHWARIFQLSASAPETGLRLYTPTLAGHTLETRQRLWEAHAHKLIRGMHTQSWSNVVASQ